MASRKSCTHMTWAEAKTRVGGGSSSKNKSDIKKQTSTHKELLAQKIIAKAASSTASTETTVTRAQQRRQERADSKACAALAEAREQRRREADEQAIRTPSEWAQLRMHRLVDGLHEKDVAAANESARKNGVVEESEEETMAQVVECRQLQLDEITALEAIFVDSDEFRILESCRRDDLQDMLEKYQENEGDETVVKSVAQHPDLAFTLALTIEDNRGLGDDNDLDLVASVVLMISLPQFYPCYNMPPEIKIHDIMVTSRTAAPIRSDKTLESLVHLQYDALSAQMREECVHLLPELCIYEIANTWLSEHLFEFAELRTHALLK